MWPREDACESTREGCRREGGRRGRNVCGADCGNVISRYVAVGRPSSSWYRHLPTYDLSSARTSASRVVVVVVIVANTRRAKMSGRITGISLVPELGFFSRFHLAFLSSTLPHLAFAPVLVSMPARGSESRAKLSHLRRESNPRQYSNSDDQARLRYALDPNFFPIYGDP